MAVLTVKTQQQLDDYSVLTTLTNSEIVPGQSITVASLATTAFNGAFTVYACPQYLYVGVDSTYGIPEFDENYPVLNQVMYYNVQTTDITTTEIHAGTITYTQTCSWITGPQIATYLSITTAGDETAFLVQCASAANLFCYRRRQESNYTDSLTTSPGGDVTLGTLMYGSALYRQRGSVDTFASFESMGSGVSTTGLTPIIKQLLGINRVSVA